MVGNWGNAAVFSRPVWKKGFCISRCEDEVSATRCNAVLKGGYSPLRIFPPPDNPTRSLAPKGVLCHMGRPWPGFGPPRPKPGPGHRHCGRLLCGANACGADADADSAADGGAPTAGHARAPATVAASSTRPSSSTAAAPHASPGDATRARRNARLAAHGRPAPCSSAARRMCIDAVSAG